LQLAGCHDGLQGLFFRTLTAMRSANKKLQYWDSITREDLEFSVGVKQHNWEVKELLPDEDKRGTIYNDSEYAGSIYHQQGRDRVSHYSAVGY
jgi:hypothetical protein